MVEAADQLGIVFSGRKVIRAFFAYAMFLLLGPRISRGSCSPCVLCKERVQIAEGDIARGRKGSDEHPQCLAAVESPKSILSA